MQNNSVLHPVAISLSGSSIRKLRSHRQLGWNASEAGGQLFGTISGEHWKIEDITGPRSSDLRTSRSYEPDRRAEQSEIDFFFGRGLHYLGDWHTHRERRPTPSSIDIATIKSVAAQSNTPLPCLLLGVIGMSPDAHSWFFGAFSETTECAIAFNCDDK